MSARGLSSRAIIGEFYNRLQQSTGMTWIEPISMLFTSDQESETYKWLGMSPVMREWIGGRNAKGFRENGLTIENKHFEATIYVLVSEMRRDKTGQVMVRIRELADRANTHWASLLATLILNGKTALCYDGKYFFATDHAEGDNQTAQSNLISVNIGTPTAPTAEEMEAAILAAVTQILGYKDDQNEPMNEQARAFVVMVPLGLMSAAAAALKNVYRANGGSNTIQALSDFNISLQATPRLTWTDQFVVVRTDGNTKPFIRQAETEEDLKVQAEGSPEEFNNDRHSYGIDAWRNVGYGYWQHACHVTFT